MLLGLCRTIAQLQQQLSDREAEAAGLQEKFESVLASLGDSTGTSADLLLTVKRWQRKLHDLTQSREKWRQQALGQRQQARGQIEQLLLAKQKLDLLVGKLGGGDPDLAVKRTLTKLERRTETLAKLQPLVLALMHLLPSLVLLLLWQRRLWVFSYQCQWAQQK